MRRLSFVLVLLLFASLASAQNCPSGWTKRVGFDDCYLVISSEKKTWDEAREACHELDGDLVSINEPGENEWILTHLSGVLSFYWIGLIDNTGSGNFVWSDGSAYDPTTAYWGSTEPPSEGKRTCAIIDSLLGDWSDSDCSENENYICERSLTEPIKCAEDDGWLSLNNKCYKFIQNYFTWDGAQSYCEDYDADLVAIRNSDEQQIVNDLIENYGRSVWIGLKDMNGDLVFDKWSTGEDLQEANWDDKQPANFSQACGVVENQGLATGPWSTEDCYDVYPSICEKKEGMCYPGWKIHNGNCYQFVSNQKETWFGAKHICDGQGGFMLTVETKSEQDFIIQQLPKLQLSGSEDIWIGLSDWEEDGTIKWVDGTVVTPDSYFNFPNHHIPEDREGEVQCGYIYVESPTGQWQYGDCFELYDYVCEIPEGAAIKPYDPSDSRGSCPAGWSYFDNFCYLFNETDQNFQTGEATCASYGGHLVSIHSVEEESFLSLRLSDFTSYWIGLNDINREDQWEYTDGTELDFVNWSENEPNDDGEGEDCVEMRGYTWDRGMWNDVSCDTPYLGVICKVDAAAATQRPPTNPPNVGCYNGNGETYRGPAQITIDRELCEYWDDMTDQIINPITYPDAGLEENYCRNPNNGPAPWCYVRLELGVGWKVCDIDNCAPGVDCFEGDGYSYRGKDHITEDGDECLYWGQLSTYAYYRPANFPDAGLDGNYCRNPSGSRYGPWCYYNQTEFGSYRSKPCAVAHCNITGCYEGNGESYRGSVSKTEGGTTCLFWDDVTNVDVNPKNYPFAGLDHNYCRNPTDEDKPWCYITPMGDTAPCDVHQCSGEIGCYTYIGVDYRGKAHFTTAGVECLNWALFIDEFYPDSLDAFTQHSFSFLSGGSFTQINNIRQSQCAEYCLNTTDTYCKGFNYQRSADTCYLLEHDTSDETTSLSFLYDYYERNQTFGLEKNYCRNPTNAAAPWCYYSDPKTPSITSWNFCAVPECNLEDPGCYDPIDRGVSYRGTGHTTASGHTCMSWSETRYPPEDNPNKGLEANYCRNIFGYSGGPYCYYPGKYGPSFEYCNVPQCEVEQVCGEGWIEDPSSTYCYQIATNQASSYDEARNLCLTEGADLLSIASPEEQAYITGIIREERVTAFWTGLNDLYNEAGWEWSNGGPFSYLNWAEGEPDNAGGGEHCVVISTHNGEWSDKDCDLEFAHICKKLSLVATTAGPTTALPGGGCPRGWSGYGSHCYLIEKDMVEWNVAESYCHAIGAELASIHGIGEMQHLTAQLAEQRHSVYWFGANDLIKEDHWVFSNGTVGSPEEELNYFNWAEDEPNDAGSAGEDCATLVYSWDWEWNDYRCDATLPYVCQGVPNPEIGDDTYSVFRDTETFADAEQHCRDHGGTLATITNQDQMDQLSALLFQAYDPFEDDTFWFGLNDIKSEGRWVMGGDEDGTQVQDYTNWHWGEPNNAIFAGEDCVAMVPDDDYTWAWYDYGCDVAERFICEDIDPDAPQYRDHTYTVVDEALPWGKASEHCLKNGGQLARIRDEYIESFVEQLLYQFEEDVVLRSKGVWIGLTDISHQDFFEWSDGSKVTYTNWNAGDPSNFARKEDCTFVFTSSGTDPNGQVYRMGRWGDYDCSGEDFGYICKKDKEVVPVTDVPPPQYNCPEGWLWTSNYCYFVTSTTMSWEDGQETCLKEDCNLATIGSYSELAQLQDRLSNMNGLFWIGLNDKERVGFYQWVDGSPVTFTNWDYNQPDNADGRCVGMAVGPEDYGEWDDQTCDSRYQAICQKKQENAVLPDPPATPSPLGSCPAGWMGYGSYCFQIMRVGNISLAMSWEEAREDCRMRSFNEGSLVTLHNATVEDWLKQEAAKLTPPVDDKEGFWIGLNDRGTDGYYYWTGYVDHNYVIEYVNWGDGQPDDEDHTQNCVQMFLGEDSGGWEDENCALKRNWICEMPKLSEGLPTDLPTVNPSDSPLCGNASMWDFYEGSCYHTHGIHGQQEYKTWDNAEYVCQSLDAHLVSVHSPSENNLIRSVMLRDGFEKIWIGMRSIGGSGYQWSDGSAVDYVTWGPNQPDDHDGELACLVFSTSSGKWMHDECEEAFPYMCKKTPGASGPPTPAVTTQAPGNCPKGWFVWGNKCYQFFPELGNWDEARNVCRSNDGDLASIRNRDEQLFLTTLLDDVSYGVWIGLNDVSAEGHFTWADGSPVTFTNWAHLEPNGGTMENCAEIRHSMSEFMPGSWNDATCDSRFGALCQKARDAEETVPPPTLTACAEGYQFYENSCYKVITDQHAYEDAKYACQDRNIGQPVSLASVFDLYEQSYLELLVMRSELDEPVWLGLQYNQSSSKFEWLDGWPVYFTNWAMDEPSDGEGEGCVAFLPESGEWDNIPCDQKHSAICKYTFNLPPILPSVSTDDCPDEDWTPYGRYCFKAFVEDKDLLGQPSALYQCSQFEHTNLASIHSKEENDFISRFVDQGIYSIWIGLKNDNGGGFAWTDGSPVEFVHWDDNEPSGSDEGGNAEECVEMFTGGGHIGKWNDLGCLTERPFVCKFTSPKFIVPTDGGTDKHTGTTLPLGLIIGISVGSFLVLIIIFVGFILIRRQRRLISYFRSISGTGVSHANLYNEEDGVDDGENESSRDLRSGSFDDAMLRVN
ncbi:Macrophage mannose receptor 1 [Holothuria leucospilota]|uniref:Macrophage mannose receptor 1 n=1 Tax=Holothuria leucospilota TaxID=206669 RepID=A0A9Q1BP78_HOLLE|nr:Macrophage mannose receptor 1 [Holothuria leucospilota]